MYISRDDGSYRPSTRMDDGMLPSFNAVHLPSATSCGAVNIEYCAGTVQYSILLQQMQQIPFHPRSLLQVILVVIIIIIIHLINTRRL